MSKAFTRDDDWEEPVVPPRPPLPDGVPNYVTPRGLALLRAELARLEGERQQVDDEQGDETERRRRAAIMGRRLSDLSARIASARVVDSSLQPHDSVRFGARVKLRRLADDEEGEEREIEIVGVDEADPAHGRVAFTAPMARALIGLGVGDTATMRTAQGETVLEVLSITYAAATT